MLLTHQQLFDFIYKVFIKNALPEEVAKTAAANLLKADLRGIDSHGVARLSGYVRLIKAGRINPSAQPKIIHETPSTATYDADGGLGLWTAHEAMKIAIEKAKNVGSGWVAVQNSSHFGIAAAHAEMALENDMIGLAENAQHRAVDLCDQVLDRRRAKLVSLPFSSADRAIEDHRAGDIVSPGGEQHRLAAGLTNPDDADTLPIDLFSLLEVLNGSIKVFQRAVIGEIHSLRATQHGLTIARETMKQIGRQADETRLSQFYGQVFGMLIDSVALVQNNDSGPLAFCFRQAAYCGDAAAVPNHPRHNSRRFHWRHLKPPPVGKKLLLCWQA